jgi:hypothetical protein
MTERIARKLGFGGTAAGVLALGAYAYVVALPYRLSPMQGRLFGVAIVLQLLGVAFAVGLGIAALRGTARSRRLAFIAIALGILALLFVMFTSHAHSVSRPIA